MGIVQSKTLSQALNNGSQTVSLQFDSPVSIRNLIVIAFSTSLGTIDAALDGHQFYNMARGHNDTDHKSPPVVGGPGKTM